jgi:hypothetical protein
MSALSNRAAYTQSTNNTVHSPSALRCKTSRTPTQRRTLRAHITKIKATPAHAVKEYSKRHMALLSLALDADEWSASSPDRHTLEEERIISTK